ncbi:transforming growth factor beta-3 proprotein-like [Actinia tenebrosa]|uniref:Transforming growth factor beta-3 proprotein-like n=1 Tax=Actinia tenebrosa TaxID=6105 RepID=A0A6P8IEW9_ACTTE|nr:transforming growth factor beta-3 proprotein-like [Actinia tenebrosa]
MFQQRSLSRYFCWILMAISLATHVVLVNGKTRLGRLKESRLLAVRGQILTKLGLTAPPIDKTQRNTNKEDLEAYQAVVEESEKQHGQEFECTRHLDRSNYFAKRVVRLPLATRFGRTIQFTDATTNKLWIADVNTLTFNTDQLNGESHIERAELRLKPESLSTITPPGSNLEICLNAQPQLSRESNDTLFRECSQVLHSRFVTAHENALISIVITCIIKDWIFRSVSNNGIKIILKNQDTEKEGKSRDESLGSGPFVLVWYIPNDRYEIEKRRRKRRALDSAFCNKRPKEKRCCLRPLYIDFQRDLRWNWIHAPLGFHANYCKGKCPFMWSMNNQTHHTSIMALFNSLNPDAPSEPCCVAQSYKPLVILYYDKGKPKIEELSNMVVSSCTCI